MNKTLLLVLGGVASFVVLLAVVLVPYVVGLSNQEVVLRTTIEAKVQDNESQFDNMKKKIRQVAQVPEAEMDSLKKIFVEYADARTSQDAGKLVNWVKEAIPNVDTSTFKNLQNIILTSRDSWTQRQKELIDLKREHDVLMRKFPSNLVLSMLGRHEIKITIITSTEAKEAFTTGKDDNDNLFKK